MFPTGQVLIFGTASAATLLQEFITGFPWCMVYDVSDNYQLTIGGMVVDAS